MSYNRVILVGRLGKDPEVRHLESGASVANFTVATNEYYKDKNGERQERTEWHNVEVWRGLAQVAEKYLGKGKQVCIEGRIRTESWEDKESGNTRYRTKVVADNMVMLGKGNDEESRPPQAATTPQQATNTTNEAPQASTPEVADDLPF